MSNVNIVVLQGNLVSDPKVMGEDSNVAKFTIAVNNGFGEKQSTTFVDCVSFGKQAEIIAKHFKKGKQIIVNGRLIQNTWENEEGEKRSKLEIRLNNFDGFSFVGSGGGNTASENETDGEEKVVTATNKKGKNEKLF